jgi:hypothetical protein
MQLRRHQIIRLARYGHESVFAWEHRPVTLLDMWSRELGELIDKESVVDRVNNR